MSFGANAGLTMVEGKPFGGSLNIGGGVSRVVSLKFNDDDMATMFLTKLFTRTLTADDMLSASDVSMGSGSNFNFGGQFSLDVVGGLETIVNHKELKAIEIAPSADKAKMGEKDADTLAKEYKQNHPILTAFTNNFVVNKLSVNGSRNADTTIMQDATGYSETTSTKWNVTFGRPKVKFANEYVNKAYKALEEPVGEFIQSGIDKYQNSNKVVKAIKNTEELVGNAKKAVGKFVDKIDPNELLARHTNCDVTISKTIHRSFFGNVIDSVTEHCEADHPHINHLKDLREAGILSQADYTKLLEDLDKGKIAKICRDRRLKPEYIENLKQDQKALLKLANKTDKEHYELVKFDVVYKGSTTESAETDVLKSVTMGLLSSDVKASNTGYTSVSNYNHNIDTDL